MVGRRAESRHIEMIDSTDQKPWRERDEIREQGAEVSEREEVVGNKKHSVKRGRVPKALGEGDTVGGSAS